MMPPLYGRLIARWRHCRWCHRYGKGSCFNSTHYILVYFKTGMDSFHKAVTGRTWKSRCIGIVSQWITEEGPPLNVNFFKQTHSTESLIRQGVQSSCGWSRKCINMLVVATKKRHLVQHLKRVGNATKPPCIYSANPGETTTPKAKPKMQKLKIKRKKS